MRKFPLKIIPLGGLGEVGQNAMVVEYENEILLIDCGVLFPDLSWLGLDLVLPDFSYLAQNKEKIKGLVVTHGHEDHIGAIPFLLKEVPIPAVYASGFAGALIKEKATEYGVQSELKLLQVKAGQRIKVGVFEVEFIHVTHSTLESFALAINTPYGMIVHSGDFKFDEKPYAGPPSDVERFKEIGEREQPLMLLSDSTNSERCGHSRSETEITGELEKLVMHSEGAVIVALFASNIHRVHQLMDIAERAGRKVFLSGRSMERYVQIALEQRLLPQKGDLLQPIEDLEGFRRKQVLILSTGSQGEARSSLFRMARNENRWFKVKKGDSIILSSRNIPGNEKAINAIINQLFKLGAHVYYEDLHAVHASGHAHKQEQLQLLEFIKPRYFLPIHGEYRHLHFHLLTAQQSGFVSEGCEIIENGQVWQYDGEEALVLQEPVLVGRKWHFLGELGQMDAAQIKEKKSAARAGVVTVSCAVSKGETELRIAPQVKISGFLGSARKQKNYESELSQLCERAFLEWTPHNEEGFTREQAVGAAVKKFYKRQFDSKPLVVVHFVK